MNLLIQCKKLDSMGRINNTGMTNHLSSGHIAAWEYRKYVR